MNKIRKTLVVVFSALFVLCMALFAAGCNETNTTAEDPEAPAQSYSVSVDVNDASLGDYTITEASEDGGYAQGSLVTVTVSPKADYEAEVYVNGEAVALENNAASFSVEADTTVQVKYTYKIVANASVTGGKGTVSLSAPADGSKYASGESVTVTATPEAGYTLKSLTVNGATLLAAESDGAFVATFDISEKSYVFAEFVALRTVTIVNDADKGAVDVKLADGTPLKDGDLVAEGTELTLTVKERGSNTVKAVYVAGAYTALNGGKATFTVKGDTEVKVLYNTYYYITIPDDSEGGTITLTGGEKVGNLGYLEGTVLTLSVTVNPGYTLSITKLVGGEEEAVELTNGKYVFTVTEAVEFNIVFAEGAYFVTTEVNNTKYGTVALVDAPEEGYAYNATATLAVTPEPGYTVDYVTVNGDKIEADEPVAGRPLTYSFPVKGDTQVFVCFVATERYTVSVELGQLFAQYSAEEDAEFLAALKEGITLGGNTVKAKDEFISLECYKGQEVVLAIAAAPEDGFKFFYYENDAKERTLYAGEVTLTVTGDISIRLTAEAPAELTVTLGSAMGTEALGQATSAELLGDYEVTPTIVGNNYTFTLDKLENKPIGATAYLFKSWTVMQGTEELTANSDGTYTIPYENNADNLALTITANWVVGYKIPVDGYELIVDGKTVATAQISIKAGPAGASGLVGTIGDDRYAEAGSNADITITPKPGYRVTAFMFTLANSSAGPDFRITNSELGAFTIGAQPFLTGDLTYGTVSAQKIYKVSTESENVTLTVTGADGKVNRYKTAEGKVEAGQENVYWVDADTSVNVTVTAGKDCYLTKVSDTSATPNPTHSITGDTTSTFTLTPTDKTGDITITAETAPYLSAKVTFEKAEGVEEAYTTEYSIYFKRGGVTALYTGSQHLKAGDVLTLELQGVRDFAEILVTLNGAELTAKEDPTKENIYVYTLDALKGDVEVKVTLKPALDFSFPDPEETTGGSTTPAPVQGAWKNLDDESDSTLQIDAHAVTINGEAVTEIKDNGKTDGDVVYTLTTASGDYELQWFAGEVGYILMLTGPAEPAPAPAGRRNAAREAGAVTYFVSPEYGQSSTYNAYFANGDTAKLTKIEWTWTDGTGEEATTSTIKITSDLGQVHIALDDDNAQYVFCVEAGHYLFVIGTTAYDMTLTLDEEGNPAYITVNDIKYLNPNNKPAPEITEFRSVDMLKDGDNIQLSITLVAENYEDKDAVQADLKLVIGTDEFASYLVNVGEGYYVVFFRVAPTALHIENDNSADVALKSVAANKTYDKIVAVLGANHSATFDQDTYTLELSGEGAEQKLVLSHTHEEVVEKTIVFAGTSFVKDGDTGIYIALNIDSYTGYTKEDLLAAKLVIGTLEFTARSSQNEKVPYFDIAGKTPTITDLATNKYAVSLKVGDETYACPTVQSGQIGSVITLNGKTYTLATEGDGDAKTLNLTVAEAPTEYTVTVSVTSPVEGCSYTLTQGTDQAIVDNKVPTNATLTLKFVLADGYDVNVNVVGGTSVRNADGSYTINNLTGNVTITIDYVNASEKSITSFADSDLIGYGVNEFRIVIRFKATGYAVESVKTDITLKLNNASFNTTEVYLDGDVFRAYFLITAAEIANLENGTYKVTLMADKEYTSISTVVSAQNSATIGQKTYTLSIVDGELIVTVTGEGGGEEPTGDINIENNGEEAALGKWIYWKDGAVTVSVVKMTEEGGAPTIHAVFNSNGSTLAWGFQLFYNDTAKYPLGKTYVLTLTVTSTSNCNVSINGQSVALQANVPQSVTVEFLYDFHTEGVTNYDYGTSLFDMQVPLAANTAYDLTFANIKWAEAAKAEKGALVGDANTTTPLINSGKNDTPQDDGFMFWFVNGPDSEWHSGEQVTLLSPSSDNIGSMMSSDGKIKFSYTGGSVDYSVQLFYKNTNLKQHTKYFLTLKITLTECDSLTIRVNGQSVTLTSGDNNVEVVFEHWYNYDASRQSWETWQGNYGVDIQFPGTNFDGVTATKVGIEISNVQWYYVKGQEPAPEVQTTVTFDVGEGGSPVESQTYGKNVTFNAPNPPTKSGYKFLYWYYLNGEDQEQVQDGFVPSDHEDEEHKLTLYAKWEVDGDLGTIVTENNWAAIQYEYPEALKEGMVYTLTGNLTLTAAEKHRWEGVYLNFSKSADWTHNVGLAYDWRLNYISNDGQGNPVGNPWTSVAVAVNVDWEVDTTQQLPDGDSTRPRNWSDDMELMAAAGYSYFSAVVSYYNSTIIEVVYTLKSTFTPYNGTLGEHTLTMCYHITGALEDVRLAIIGENARLENATLSAVKHEHDFSQNNTCVCGARQYTNGQYSAILEKDYSFVNNDPDWQWWNGSTSAINVDAGDFVLVFEWDNINDATFALDAVFEMKEVGKDAPGVLDVDVMKTDGCNVWGDLIKAFVSDGQGGGGFTGDFLEGKNATQSAQGTSTAWGGHYVCTVTRIGTTITLVTVYTSTNNDVTVTNTITLTGMLTDAVVAYISGNPAPLSNFNAWYGKLTANASSHAEEGIQLAKGGNVTFNGSVTESDDVVIKLDLGDSAIYFGKGGLMTDPNGEATLTGSEISGQQVSISPSQEEMLKSGDVSVKFTLSGSDLTVHYTIASAGSGLDGVSSSYTVSITGLTGDSYTLSVAGGNASVLA